MIDDQFGDDAQAAFVRGREERLKILERAEVRIDVVIISDVVTVIAQWRRIERQEPDRGDAEFLQIIEFLDQSAQIADAVTVTVMKSFNMQLIDDRVFVPKRVGNRFTRRLRHAANCWRTKRAAQSLA